MFLQNRSAASHFIIKIAICVESLYGLLLKMLLLEFYQNYVHRDKNQEILEVGLRGVTLGNMLRTLKDFRVLNGGLAQLARAPALHAGGHRFDSDILHD